MTLSPKAMLEISQLSHEAERLARGNAQDRAQSAVLVQRIKNVRESGLSSDEVRQRYADALLEETAGKKKVSEERYFQAFARYLVSGEERDLVTGTQSISWTQGVQGGYSVPIQYSNEVAEALAQTDPLLDPDVTHFTMADTETLQPQIINGWDLSTITAQQVNETIEQGAGAVPSINGRVLRANIIYKISLAASIEAEQDVPDVLGKFARAYGVGFARKLGQDAVNGNGTTQPQGVFTALPSPSYTTGATKITLTDITSIYFKIDRAYRSQPKCGWLMHDSVYQRIRNAVDNSGRPLLSVKDDKEELMGKPVYVSPSLPLVGGSPVQNGAIVFGDLNHFYIRCSRPTILRELNAGIKGIEFGEALYVGRIRMDSALFDPSNGTAPPLVWATVTN